MVFAHIDKGLQPLIIRIANPESSGEEIETALAEFKRTILFVRERYTEWRKTRLEARAAQMKALREAFGALGKTSESKKAEGET